MQNGSSGATCWLKDGLNSDSSNYEMTNYIVFENQTS